MVCSITSEQGNSSITAFNPDGSIKWTFLLDINDKPLQPIVDAEGTVYIGVNPSGSELPAKLLAINSDGTLKWSYTINPGGSSEIASQPAIASDGTLYIMTTSKLYAFGSSSGLVLETSDLLPEDYLPTQTMSTDINSSIAKVFGLFVDLIKTLKIILNWPGSELQFKLYDPNGDLYGVYQTNTPPIVVDIPEAQPGTWTTVVTGIDVPEDNYEFALVTGVTTPTLIRLSSFTATPSHGKVIIEWTTESEIDCEGFNIYRAESENGQYVKINPSLIPAQGTSTSGATYKFVDENVKYRRTYYYKLEDIDIYGKSTFHGLVSARPKFLHGKDK
jgi:hypothetical protein